jgi:hypothetical protein
MPRIAEAPPPGIKRNGTPEASSGAYWDMNNMRWRGGVLQPIGGNVALAAAVVPDPIRDVLTWHDLSGTRWAAIGSDQKLYAYNFDLQTLTDITPTGVGPLESPGALVGYGLGDYGTAAYGTARDASDIGPTDVSGTMGDIWSMDTFGEQLLFVPTQDGHLYMWDPSTPATAPLLIAEAPTQNLGVIVTDQRQVVLIGAGADLRNIAWSDQENYHVWAPDVTNLAGSKRLVTQARVQSALKVSQGILIFTSNDLHLMQYVGPPYAYGIIQVAAGCGPLSLRAPVSIGSMAVWPSLQNWWMWNGNCQPLSCDVKDWFFSLLNQGGHGKMFGAVNPQFAELWWYWPDEGSTECNRYLALNYGISGTINYGATSQYFWMIGQEERTAADRLGVLDHPILAGPDGTQASLYFHEYGTTDNGAPRAPTGAVYAETGAIALSEGSTRFHVKQLIGDWAVSDMSNPPVAFQFFYKENPANPVETTTGVYSVVHDGLVDIRFSGRTARMRIEGTRDEPWALGRIRLELRQGGRR